MRTAPSRASGARAGVQPQRIKERMRASGVMVRPRLGFSIDEEG